MQDQTLYEAVGGWDGVLRLAHAWHEAVLADPVVSHAFSHGFGPDHTMRLAAYWAEAWGGPPEFTERYGNESSVVRIHSGNGVHEEMDRRAIACFDRALEVAGIEDARLSRALSEYFAWATTKSMAAYPHSKTHVPDDLLLPRWTWDGPVALETEAAHSEAFDDRDPTPDDPESKEDRGRAYFADGITVYFNARKCWHTGICLRGLPLVFEVGRRPWVRADLDTPERIAAQIDLCPSKALTYDLIAEAVEPGPT